MNHPLIIGAGGVASYLLPVLLKTFRPRSLTIIDKDVLEERNLDRQMFSPALIGLNKAHALCGMVFGGNDPTRRTVIEDWFSESTVIPDDIDAIICVADNHEARRNALQRAETLGVNAYVGGNEYFDSEAYVYRAEWKNTPRDPLVRYPEIATNHEGSPFRCTGDAQVAAPQLAIANLSCAAKLLHLLWLYEVWLPKHRRELDPEALKHLPIELFTGLMGPNLITHG